jgi:hypothetical protein
VALKLMSATGVARSDESVWVGLGFTVFVDAVLGMSEVIACHMISGTVDYLLEIDHLGVAQSSSNRRSAT